jgi:putative protein-disulfide isomerase
LLLVFTPVKNISDKPEMKDKPQIIYVYDALCGWCYGFSPVMQKLHDNYSSRFDFIVVSGGMITGNRIGEISKMAPYISSAYKGVEKTTGIQFGKNFLEGTLKEGTAIFSSVKPSIALSIIEEAYPDKVVLFAAEIQRAIYFDGIEPDKPEAYIPYVEKMGLEKDAFLSKMNDPLYLQKAKEDFLLANDMGVQGFPAVFVKMGDQVTIVANGYTSYPQLEKSIMKLLK